jgi:hypothetical protein
LIVAEIGAESMDRSSGYVKKIDFVFFNERKIRQLVREAKEESVRGGHGANGSGISDPTAAQALHNLLPIKFVMIKDTRLEWPEAWLHVIDMVRTRLDPRHLIVMNDHYNKVHYSRTQIKLDVQAQSTISRMMSEVRHLQELCAVQEGLIRIY